MRRPLQPADEGLAAWVERWAPSDRSVWDHWRTSLPPELRREALFPLQAALCGLDALRSFENQLLEGETLDFHEHLHAACATYGWALSLADELRAGSREVGVEPLRSLDALRSSLADAAHVSERLLELNIVDAGLFHSTCDMFLRDVARNDFFCPPRALEVSSDAFVGLLRLNRLVGVGLQRLDETDGESVAVVVLAAVRRDLHELSHVIADQGNDEVAAELEPGLLMLDANDTLPGRMAHGTEASRDRMRAGLLELRSTLKRAAKRLRGFGDPPVRDDEAVAEDDAPQRQSERVPVDIAPDVWAFRLIVRAFVAKATATLLDGSESIDPSKLSFVSEFVGHFRVFGPKLTKGTAYSDPGPLIRAVSALSEIDGIDEERLSEAIAECEPFEEHLAFFLAERSDSVDVSFDKQKAAQELRGYLEVAKREPEKLRDFG